MKIIILGAGQVGVTLTEHLADEQNDVTVVDSVRNQPLRTYRYIDGNGTLLEKFLVFIEIVYFANSADFCWRAVERVSNSTGEHINFVAVGDGDEHIRVLCAGVCQRGWFRGVTFDGPDIQALLQLSKCGVRAIHHRDIVLFVGEVFGERAANLPSSQNNDLHDVRGSLNNE